MSRNLLQDDRGLNRPSISISELGGGLDDQILRTNGTVVEWETGLAVDELLGGADGQYIRHQSGAPAWTDELIDKGGAVYNVKHPDFGAVGDGVTDDTAAIQAAIDATSEGDVVLFPTSSSPYLVTGDIILKSGRSYVGGGSYNTPTTIKLADSSNPSGVLVSESWYNNLSTAGSPIRIEGIRLDCNKDNNSSGHGIVLSNFRCLLRRVQVRNAEQNGIYFSQNTRDGSALSGTAVENVLEHCFVIGAGNYGIRVEDSTAFFTDGFLLNTIVANTGAEDGVRVDHSTGWLIDGYHIYGTVPKYAIHARNCDKTRIVNGYVERYGGSTSATGVYEGIFAHCLVDVIIANNDIVNDNDVAGSTYSGLRVTTAGAVTAKALVKGNNFEGNGTDNSIMTIATTGGGTMEALVVGNHSDDNTSGVTRGSNVTAIYSGNRFDQGAVVTIADGDTTPTVNGGPVLKTANTGATTITDFGEGVEGQEIRVIFGDGNTTIDFTGTTLKGNAGVDWSPANGDSMTCTYDGTNWYCDVQENV